MSHPLLEASNISHSFDTDLFSNVNFSLNPSESAVIVGRSGSGKSTLLHIFSTFLTPNEGSVTLFSKDLYAQKDTVIEAIRRFDVGMVFQSHYLFKGMTALENIEVATMLSESEIDDALLEKLEIKAVIGKKIGELSGGQQQRVSIARVLSKKPRLIFADEPTGNLDNETAALVMDVLLDYVKENAAGLVLVTHDEKMAVRCDKLYKLEDKVLKEEV